MADPKPSRLRSLVTGSASAGLKYLAATAAGVLVGVVFGITPQKVIETRVVEVAALVAPPADPAVTTGWTPDAEANELELAAARFKSFADTPAGQIVMGDLPKEVFLWKAVEKLTGRPTPLKDQNPTGACVGFGTDTAVERTEATEILARGGDPSEFTFFSEEVAYAGAKVQGFRSLGGSVSRSDGATDVGAAAWVTKVGGMVPKGKYGKWDLTEYDPARARSWNVSGVPAELVEVAKKYPVKDSVRVLNWNQCKQALASGYAVAGCALWKYGRTRDANGVAQDLGAGIGAWNHCMCIDGYYAAPDGREFGHVENSWSNLPDDRGRRTGQPYHTGPVGWGNPSTAGFWATAESLDRALRQGGSRAYSGVTGFPARRNLWDLFIAAPRRTDPFARFTLIAPVKETPCGLAF
ncbi:hypothetical protein [Gemmata sp.]|uniref:hypothetical protein n=1 Tax=Gemmata sp. TaxID=1914242 RepID=UPI003F7213E6